MTIHGARCGSVHRVDALGLSAASRRPVASHALPGGVNLPVVGLVNGGLLVTVVALTVAVGITALVSRPNGDRVSTPRQALAIVGVWYGYPIVLGGVFVIALNLAGIGTYRPPEWVP